MRRERRGLTIRRLAASLLAGPLAVASLLVLPEPAAEAKPKYGESWHFLNGSKAAQAGVRRAIGRLHFPHKRFVARYVAIKFGGRAKPGELGFATPRKGYVLIGLKSRDPVTIAHEIGHAADALLFTEATVRRYKRPRWPTRQARRLPQPAEPLQARVAPPPRLRDL